MFEYMTVQEAAKKWNLSERRVQKLCAENRIAGVVHLSRIWLIPQNAHKPVDGRKKENKIFPDRKSTRLNSSHREKSRMPSSA